jgi:hypothetical protein
LSGADDKNTYLLIWLKKEYTIDNSDEPLFEEYTYDGSGVFPQVEEIIGEYILVSVSPWKEAQYRSLIERKTLN